MQAQTKNTGFMENDELKRAGQMLRFLASDELREFFSDKKNCEIKTELDGLTEWRLREDLDEAKKYRKGYFRNKKGQYIHVKGVEVTNDTSNLCRMGFNGEDRGVWIHYCIVDDRRVQYNDVPVFTFAYFFDPSCSPKDELFVPTTRKKFEEAVERAVSSFIGGYKEKRDPREYISFFEELDKIYEKTSVGDDII